MSSNELSSTTVRSVDDDELDALSDDWENIFDSKIMTDYVYYTVIRACVKKCVAPVKKILIGNVTITLIPNPN